MLQKDSTGFCLKEYFLVVARVVIRDSSLRNDSPCVRFRMFVSYTLHYHNLKLCFAMKSGQRLSILDPTT